MGIAKRTVGAAFGASLMVAAAVGIGPATAFAEPEAPATPTSEAPATSASEAPASEAPATPAPATPAPATPAPAGNVHYRLTTGAPYDFTITYLVNQPASKQAFNADSNAYLQRVTVNVSPDAPWTFDANLADPQWAFLQVGSTTHGGQGAPNATCEITVNGQVASHQEHPYSPQCLLSQW